ncbi:MAG: tetratricopeptide repeat protein [Acidobacteriota bacterium]
MIKSAVLDEDRVLKDNSFLEENRILNEEVEARVVRWVLSVILIFSALSRFVYLITYLGRNPFAKVLILDSLKYDQWAKAILEGRLFEEGAFYQAPFYPYFVSFIYSIFSPSPVGVYVVQMLIGLATTLLVFLVAKRYFSGRTALLASAIFALHPTITFFESKLLPETLAILIGLMLLYMLKGYAESEERRTGPVTLLLSAGSGILLGISCLIRPNMLLLFPLAFLWIMLSGWRKKHLTDEAAAGKGVRIFGRRIVHAAAFSAGFLVAILPVTYRNYLRSGDFVLISLNGGITFCQGNNPYAYGIYTPLPGFSGDIVQQRMEERYYAQAQSKRALSDQEISRFWFDKGLQFIRMHPWQWVLLEMKKFFYFFDSYEHSLEYNYSIEREYVINMAFIPFGIIISFALFGIIASYPWRGKAPLMLYLSVQFFTVMIFYMSSRYRLPAVPVLCIFAGAGISHIMDIGQPGKIRKSVFAMMAIIVISVFSFLKMGDVYRFEEAASYGNLGTAFNAAGMHEEAISSFKKQSDLDPRSAYAPFNIAVVLAKMGRNGEAVEYYQKTIAINPDLAEAYNNLGVIFVNWGECAKAEVLFLKAIELKPFFANPYNNLATCYFVKGELQKAMEMVRLAKSRGLSISEELEKEITVKQQLDQ